MFTLQQSPEAKAPPSLGPAFTSVARGKSDVIATKETYAALSPSERAVLEKSNFKTLIIAPQDALVRGSSGEPDYVKTGENLRQIIGRYFPGDKGNFSNNELQRITDRLDVADRYPALGTGALSLGGQACLIEMKPDKNPRLPIQMGLPAELVRPEVLSLYDDASREFDLEHELGHCKIPPQIDGDNQFSRMGRAEEAEDNADSSAFTTIGHSQRPDRDARLRLDHDSRAIDAMRNNILASRHNVYSDTPLWVTDHATSALLIKPDQSPLTGIAGNALANSAIYHLMGLHKLMEDGSADPLAAAGASSLQTDLKLEAMGHKIAESDPLAHYAAAKALRDTGALDKKSLAYLYVDTYVDAMERFIKSDVIKDMQVTVDDDKALIAASRQAGQAERLTVTADKEEKLTNTLLADPRNSLQLNFAPIPPVPLPADAPAPR